MTPPPASLQNCTSNTQTFFWNMNLQLTQQKYSIGPFILCDICPILRWLVAERQQGRKKEAKLRGADCTLPTTLWCYIPAPGIYSLCVKRRGHPQRNTGVCSLQLERPRPGWWDTWKGPYKKTGRRAAEVARQETMSLVIQISRGSSWDFWQTYPRASGGPRAPELILLSCCKCSCGEHIRHRRRSALVRCSSDRSFNFKPSKSNRFFSQCNLKKQSHIRQVTKGSIKIVYLGLCCHFGTFAPLAPQRTEQFKNDRWM